MKLTSLFIDRPVLSTVLNITIVLFGLITVGMLGVRDYPAVDPPVITVSTSYTGANADVIESKITEPLEQSINGIAGIRTLTSSSSDGSSRITVEFNLETDLEAAANDVRDKVSRAMRNLPPDADNPVVTKADANSTPIIFITLQSDTRTPLQLTDYASDIFRDQLQTIPGISEVTIWGEKRRAMRLWMDPAKMAARGVTPQDVKSAVDKENVELPSGRIEGNLTELTIRTSGNLSTPEEFNKLILKEESGRVTRFCDIGQAVEGAENERTIMKRNGVPMIGVALIPQAGSNHISISKFFYKRLGQLKKQLPPDVKAEIGFDTTQFVKTSVKEVLETILMSFLLVVFVIFTFLRNWRATLIPILAMPISLIGAFFIMYICGFSINILTLLGIVLATGLVVDDAIVVLENIYQKIEGGHSPREAGHKGSSEIVFAIIATTLSLMAVMLPIIVMSGMTGRLFREFGVVVAGSVAISAFVSLSITPMLCSRILKHHDAHEKSLYGRTEPFFLTMIQGYRNALVYFLGKRWIAFVVIALSVGLIYLFFTTLPKELAPLEDRGRFNVGITGPEGASYEYMVDATEKIVDVTENMVAEKDALITMVPSSFGGSGSVNSGNIRVLLVNPDKRERSQMEIANALSARLRGADVRAIVSQEQTIGDRRGGLPVQLVITAPSFEQLRSVVPQFIQATARDSTFQMFDINMKFSKPEIKLTIDRDRARDLGISVMDIAQSLQLSMSGSRYGYYIYGTKQYSIIGQLFRQDRNNPLDLTSFLIRNKEGKFIPLENAVTTTESGSPPQLYHYNRSISATVSAGLAPGKTIGDGVKAIQGIASKVLPEGFGAALAGPSRDFAESSSNLVFAFLFALVLVYLVLSAQFESFRHPFIVMLTVPMALAGALFSLWYFNQSLNIFSQIGLIMLVGLVTKNGILIVEFTNQRRHQGLELREALVEAAVSRFRPIVMTTLTVVLGSLPIALSLGASSQSRVSLGIAIIGGLLFSLVLSLFVVPIMYTFMAGKLKHKV
jgi:multidrug efflux pump